MRALRGTRIPPARGVCTRGRRGACASSVRVVYASDDSHTSGERPVCAYDEGQRGGEDLNKERQRDRERESWIVYGSPEKG